MSGAGTGPARGRPFLVAVGALRRKPGAHLDVDVAAPLDDELRVSNAWVPHGASVGFAGLLESALGGVTVAGVVRAPWEGTCRRCLDPVHGMLEVAVRELCLDDPDPELGYAVGRDYLDLEPIVHDACILELPLAPLCVETCLGLCPQCGANRSRESCSCEVPVDPAVPGMVSPEETDETPGQGPE